LPTYEYECPSCSSHFELIRSFGDDGDVACPECGCDAYRIFSPVPVIFKGSGFYVTDHRNNNQPKSAIGKDSSDKGESAAAGTTGAGGSGKDG
jgi:putative FmdB family regulatory protein